MKYDYDILVVDDEVVVLDAVSKICQFNQLTIDRAIDGSVAIDKIKSHNYKVVLCDIMMPQLDGFQFLKEFTKINSTTPIIITSGFSTNENAVKVLQDGAFDFIAKPFSFEELSNTISRALNYQKHYLSVSENKIENSVHSLYVACPPHYYRLGYLSWAKREKDGAARVGIVNLYFQLIETPKEIIFQKEESRIYQGSDLLTIISADGSEHTVLSPLSGKIIEINKNIIDDFDLIGKDPYFGGWLYHILPDDLDNELLQLVPCSSDRV